MIESGGGCVRGCGCGKVPMSSIFRSWARPLICYDGTWASNGRNLKKRKRERKKKSALLLYPHLLLFFSIVN